MFLGAKTSKQQTTAHTTTKTQTTTTDNEQNGGAAPAVLLQSDSDVTSGSSSFRVSTLVRQRMPFDVVRTEVWSDRVQTAGGAVASFSQTFPAGTRTGLIELTPAFWRHESYGITYPHAHMPTFYLSFFQKITNARHHYRRVGVDIRTRNRHAHCKMH